MTTETTCLSSIWTTDEKVRDYMAMHGRAGDYAELRLEGPASYDGLIRVDLSRIVPMIALPFHPSNVYPVAEVAKHGAELLAEVESPKPSASLAMPAKGLNMRAKVRDGGVWVDQGIIAGCAGGNFENIALAAAILDGKSTGNQAFNLPCTPPANRRVLRSSKTAQPPSSCSQAL